MTSKKISVTENESTEIIEATEKAAIKQKGFMGFFRGMSLTVKLTIAILFCGCIALFSTIAFFAHTNSLKASAAEYDFLREFAGDIISGSGSSDFTHLSALDQEMLQINPDYVFWIRVDGTSIAYPVVQGSDNVKYLNTSFYGEPNKAGTVFMDFRNIGDSLKHTIIYGHNLQQGGMFTDLHKFLNPRFLEENNIITLIVNDHIVEFKIFSARLTDVNDPAYNLALSTPRLFARFADSIGAPIQATQIITLSTCVSTGNDDARMIVQGYRIFR